MKRRPLLISLALVGALLVPASAHAREPLVPVSLPILGSELDRGAGSTVPADPVAPSSGRVVDGLIDDWVGRPSRFAGTAVYSGGEYVYQDYLFDSYGADNGEDVERNRTYESLSGRVPELYRAEMTSRYLAGELGAPPPFEASTTYGDLGPLFTADVEELHVATQADGIHVLTRTTSLTSAAQTGILLLVDTLPGNADREVGFNSGLVSDRADHAVLLAGTSGWVRSLATGAVTPLAPGSVATNPDGFTNAIEARIPHAAVNLPANASRTVIAAAAGPLDAAGSGFKATGLPANVANVAFRFNEPVREWMERRQAFDLYRKTIDPFFTVVNLDRLRAGATERFVPGPGYHERIFLSSPEISVEGSRDGIWQPYGLYLPKSYQEGGTYPLQLWLHWRGGTAHSAGTATPRIFRDFGDAWDTIVVSPRGRGTSSWYVGRGHVDVLEVLANVKETFAVDANRVYLAGHSMGGYGSFLFSVLHPDLFAGALPASPPATQGAWTGVDFPGCDRISDGENSPCYIEANDGRARDQHYQRMLGNLRHVPVAIYTGVADELVPYPGVLRHHLDLVEKWRYRNRLYSFPTQEHYGPPVWDQWKHGARYLHSFTRNPNPARVTYRRDMPYELAVEQVNNGGVALDFDFDHAYWMSELTPADAASGAAIFDGRTGGVYDAAHVAVPEAQGPAANGQTGPYVMTGLKWMKDPTAPAWSWTNAFEATLQGATAVKLDLPRMALTLNGPLKGTVTTDKALELRLRGPWSGVPSVQAPSSLSPSVSGDVLTLHLPAGTTTFTITA